MSNLLKNTFWNLFGSGAPLIVAVFAIPIIISGFGIDQFGILTLIWAFIGYFSIFDLGIGRAITQNIAALPETQRDSQVTGIFWTGLLLVSLVGLVGMVTILGYIDFIIEQFIKPEESLLVYTYNAVLITAYGVPVVTTAIALRSLLEGYQRFDIINKGRLPLGLWTFLCPLLVLNEPNKLAIVCVLLITGRAFVTIYYLWHCKSIVNIFFTVNEIGWDKAKALLRFGSWMSVTNIIGPILVTIDRFYISTMLGIGFVAYYVTPFEIASRTTVLAYAVSAVLFPNFAQLFVTDRLQASKVYNMGLRSLIIILFPIYLVMILGADRGLELWLGRDFADNSTLVFQILSIGVFLNSLALIPFAFIQGAGRPDLTAKLHMAEASFYFILLYVLIDEFGIVGAAAAWTIRMFVDFIALIYLVVKINPNENTKMVRTWQFLSLQLLILFSLLLTEALSFYSIVFLFLGTISWGYSYQVLLTKDERALILSKITMLGNKFNGK